jgi:hypothetical protein
VGKQFRLKAVSLKRLPRARNLGADWRRRGNDVELLETMPVHGMNSSTDINITALSRCVRVRLASGRNMSASQVVVCVANIQQVRSLVRTVIWPLARDAVARGVLT